MTKVWTRRELGDKIARAIAPRAWAEYDRGEGKCTNGDGWAVMDSIEQSARVMTVLHDLGFPVSAPSPEARVKEIAKQWNVGSPNECDQI